MANINIEKKDKKSTWPWVLGLLLVLALVSWLVWDNVLDPDRADVAAADEYFDADPIYGRTDAGMTDADNDEAYMPAGVMTFINFINAEDTKAKMGLDHNYTSNGIEYLAEALNEMSTLSGLEAEIIRQHYDVMMDRADRIEQDPASLKHANSIRDAFIAAANWMEVMKEKGLVTANGQIDKVEQAAQSIDTTVPTLDQKDNVINFFQRSENALQEMTMPRE